jgi:hypothetical protein
MTFGIADRSLEERTSCLHNTEPCLLIGGDILPTDANIVDAMMEIVPSVAVAGRYDVHWIT